MIETAGGKMGKKWWEDRKGKKESKRERNTNTTRWLIRKKKKVRKHKRMCLACHKDEKYFLSHTNSQE